MTQLLRILIVVLIMMVLKPPMKLLLLIIIQMLQAVKDIPKLPLNRHLSTIILI